MLSQKDKELLIKAFESVDPKELEVDDLDEDKMKWFRFGSHNGLQIAISIVRRMPVKKYLKKEKVS